jgi:predicted transcriptional regulator
MEVRHQRRFGTEVEAAAIAAAQIRTLIDSISRSVQSLNYDIKTEEERTKCWDCRDPAYSVSARSLTARRDNLAATMAALQKRREDAEALT